MKPYKHSALSGFYRLSIEERRNLIQAWLGDEETVDFDKDLQLDQADTMIENVISGFTLPFAIATNFQINGVDYLIPMVVEEPSVVAAVSNAAKLFRANGGIKANSDEPIMIGQLQLLDLPSIEDVVAAIEAAKEELLTLANSVGGSIVRRGGGARDIEIRVLEETAVGPMVILHLLFDTRDAMGANAINTALEFIAPYVEEVTGARVHLRILSNLSDRRKAFAEVVIRKEDISHSHDTSSSADAILEAYAFAESDPYRATTHNKGIMNGIDAVAIATGNDWRALEAGAHAYAARRGRYTSLTTWKRTETGDLHGSIEMPLAVGIIGGATRVHPKAQLAIRLLGVDTAQQLAEIMVAVGLAQNFAALRALATDGIQKGHMRMHARQLATAAGATPEQVPAIAAQLISENTIRLERAKALVESIQQSTKDK